jgi:iron-sulfur cluster repair protein YtfE (RIC family)
VAIDLTPDSDVREVSSSIRDSLIRDLVEEHPEMMPVLAEHGFDLCCGGGHTVAEAASLHGVDVDDLVGELITAMRRVRG